MNKLSMAIAGTGVMALSMVEIAPVEAADLTRLDYSGSASVSLPWLFLDGGTTLDLPVDSSTVVDNFSGRLADTGDTELTIPFLSYLEEYLPEFFSDRVSLSAFEGSGSIFSDAAKTNELSEFEWSYNSVEDIVTVDGYDFNNIETCLVGTCYLTGNGEVSATLATLFNPTINAELRFDLSQTATPVSYNIPVEPSVQVTMPPTLDMASVPEPVSSLAVNSETESVPEPATLVGLFGLAAFFAAKRKRAKVS